MHLVHTNICMLLYIYVYFDFLLVSLHPNCISCMLYIHVCYMCVCVYIRIYVCIYIYLYHTYNNMYVIGLTAYRNVIHLPSNSTKEVDMTKTVLE